jgi:hypothetical protein
MDYTDTCIALGVASLSHFTGPQWALLARQEEDPTRCAALYRAAALRTHSDELSDHYTRMADFIDEGVAA